MIPRIGFGTAGLLNGNHNYSSDTSESEALQTIHRMFAFGPCLLDTSRNYGSGGVERLVGLALRSADGISGDLRISTKVDRDFVTNVLDLEAFHRSLQTSIDAIGVKTFDFLFIHDPEYAVDWEHHAESVLDELVEVRESGLATQIGVASGNLQLVREAFERADLDCALVHNRFTLMNRNAACLFSWLKARNKTVVNAAPFGGGALAKGVNAERYVYQEITDGVRASLAYLETLCREFEVDLMTAALHFSLESSLVDCTIVGVTSPAQFDGVVAALDSSVPRELLELLSEFPASQGDPESARWSKE